MDELKKKYVFLRNVFIVLFVLSVFGVFVLYDLYSMYKDNSSLEIIIKILFFFMIIIAFIFIPYCLCFYIHHKNPFDFEFNSDIQLSKPINIVNYIDFNIFDNYIKDKVKELGYFYYKRLDFFENASLEVFLKDESMCSPRDDKIVIFRCKKLMYGRYDAKYKNMAYIPKSSSIPFRKMFFDHFNARGRIPNDFIKTIVFIIVEEWSPYVDDILDGIHEQDNIVVVVNKEDAGVIQITSDNRKIKGEDYFLKYNELMSLFQRYN